MQDDRITGLTASKESRQAGDEVIEKEDDSEEMIAGEMADIYMVGGIK